MKEPFDFNIYIHTRHIQLKTVPTVLRYGIGQKCCPDTEGKTFLSLIFTTQCLHHTDNVLLNPTSLVSSQWTAVVLQKVHSPVERQENAAPPCYQTGSLHVKNKSCRLVFFFAQCSHTHTHSPPQYIPPLFPLLSFDSPAGSRVGRFSACLCLWSYSKACRLPKSLATEE